jgi:hypothetical protein
VGKRVGRFQYDLPLQARKDNVDADFLSHFPQDMNTHRELQTPEEVKATFSGITNQAECGEA